MNDTKLKALELGKPIPKILLHMEFDYGDTIKYAGDKPVESQEELDRLNSKYLPTGR